MIFEISKAVETLGKWKIQAVFVRSIVPKNGEVEYEGTVLCTVIGEEALHVC